MTRLLLLSADRAKVRTCEGVNVDRGKAASPALRTRTFPLSDPKRRGLVQIRENVKRLNES